MLTPSGDYGYDRSFIINEELYLQFQKHENLRKLKDFYGISSKKMREALINADVDLVAFFDAEYRRAGSLNVLAIKHAIKAELLSELLKQSGRNIQKGNHSKDVSKAKLLELHTHHEGNISAMAREMKMDRTTVRKKLHIAGLTQESFGEGLIRGAEQALTIAKGETD